MIEDPLTEMIIGAAIAVHRALGPGLLESTYTRCLAYELVDRDLSVEVGKPVPLVYKNLTVDNAYRIDILVENRVVIELKAVERLERVHISQLLTYLKLSGMETGLLLNFNVPMMKDGIRRIYNNAPVPPSLPRSL
jgi:GxxExxY protein